MLSSLLFYIVFESLEPSYATLTGMFPPGVVVAAMAQTSILTLGSQNAPIKTGDSIAPVIEAKSIFAVDLNSGAPLFVRDVFSRRPIASIEKLVTAMVILDKLNLNEKVKISRNAAEQEGSKMGLKSGEEITVENLLTGMLINSGNDAAVALAEFEANSESEFIKQLNDKAVSLGLKDTHFSNAKGFDESNNYSTAYDTMIFSRAALAYPFIKKTVSIKTYEVASVDGKITHHMENTNELLENQYFKVIGMKTGTTPAAGQSFVGFTKGPNNHDILTVVLDSPDRFKETEILLDWIFRNFNFTK